MKILVQLYKTFNILSLDITAGAIISALFFARVFNTCVQTAVFLCLGLTVWIIYTSDHLVDAKALKDEASTARHRFHQKHFKMLVGLLIAAAVADACFSILINRQTFYWGVALGAVVLLYFLIQSNLKILKEPAGALLYAAGVLLPSLAIFEKPISLARTFLIMQFVNVALINLILFSLFDCELDRKDQRCSVITTLGLESGKILLRFLFFLQGCFVLLMVGFSSDASIVVIPVLMNLTLLAIFIFPVFFSAHERYRYAGDAIFFLPLCFLLY